MIRPSKRRRYEKLSTTTLETIRRDREETRSVIEEIRELMPDLRRFATELQQSVDRLESKNEPK